MNKIARTAVLFIAQGAYSGKLPAAPGTAGTLVGVLVYWAMRDLSPGVFGSLCVLCVLVGTWLAGRAEVLLGRKDSPSIVIDEIVGFLVAMFLVPSSWGFVVAGFVLFRFFDIAKPWPLKRLQDLSGGPGIMLDDIGAALYTNLLLQAAARIAFS